MSAEANVSSIAFLIADPARAAMLMALCDGRARPAGDLALAAGITAQTASSHLAKLLTGGLVLCETEGRHRYYRLAGPAVADVIERLATLAPLPPSRPRSRDAERLRFARTCYDHLAGQLGTALTGAMVRRDFLVAAPEKQFTVTPSGIAWFAEMGVDVSAIRPYRSCLARQCLDWTERTHHLAGPLGTEWLRHLCATGWVRRTRPSRRVEITPIGWAGFKRIFDLDRQIIEQGLGATRMPLD